MRITTYKKGGNSLNPFIKLSIFLMIILSLFVVPVSAESLIDTDTYTEIYGNTDTDYDYSVRYDFNFDEVVTDWSNETGFTNIHIISDQAYHSRTYYQAKPTILYIDFAEYSGLYSLSSTTLHVPPSGDFGFSTGFVLTSSEGYTVGGGNVHVWGTENDNLQFYHTFSDTWNYSYTSTHQDTPASLIITYDDTSQFDLIADIQTPYISNPTGVKCNKTLRNIDLGLQCPVDIYTNWNSGSWFYDYLNTFIRADEKYTTVFDFVQSVEYKYNTGSEFGFVSLDRAVGLYDASGSRFGLSFNITDLDNNETDNHYFLFTDYENTDMNSTVGRTNGLMFDLYSNPSLDFPTFTYILDYGNDTFVYDLDEIEIPLIPDDPIDDVVIVWAYDYYTVGDTGVYEWYVDLDVWSDVFYKYQVQIMHNGVVVETNGVDDTGVGYYNFDSSGAYVAEVQSSLFWPTNWITRGTATTSVSDVEPSYINVPLSDYTGNSFEISYLYGNTPILPFLKISKRLIDNTYVDVNWIDLNDIGIVAGTIYTPTLTIYESGTYLIGIYDINLLADDNSLLVASDTIRIFYKDAIEQIVISTSKIDTNNVSIIGLGDTLTGNYQVDSMNYTNMSTRLEVYNYENDIISFSIPKQKQKGNYQIPLSNQEFYTDQTGFVEATIYKVDSLFYTGNNQIRIAGYNQDGTFNQTLAFINITIDYVNSAGYSLILSKYTVLQNEEFIISIKCPTESKLNIWDNTGYNIKQFIISGNKDIKFSIFETGKYYFGLHDPSENLQSSQMLTVSESQIIEDDDVIPDTTFQDNTTSLLNSPYLIGLFIMCVFLAIGATNGIGGTIVTGSIGLGIVCYMGIFPWILLVIEVLVVAVLMGKGIINLSGD